MVSDPKAYFLPTCDMGHPTDSHNFSLIIRLGHCLHISTFMHACIVVSNFIFCSQVWYTGEYKQHHSPQLFQGI